MLTSAASHIPRGRLGRRIIACLAAFLCITPLTVRSDATESPVESSLAEVVNQQDPRVGAALERIDGTGRRLLALRSYLRSREHLAERWSWTDEQIENPGYELWVNPQVRSLDRQIASWNGNESVAAAADALLAKAAEFVESPAFKAAKPERHKDDFAHFLVSYLPVPTPTVAAPGLSPHGQMRAIDFQVLRDGSVVAGPKTATIDSEWDAAGWSARLDRAVREGSTRFVGPLATPREPWHYTYSPEAVAAQ